MPSAFRTKNPKLFKEILISKRETLSGLCENQKFDMVLQQMDEELQVYIYIYTTTILQVYIYIYTTTTTNFIAKAYTGIHKLHKASKVYKCETNA